VFVTKVTQRKNFWYAMACPYQNIGTMNRDRVGTVSFQSLRRMLAVGLLLFSGFSATCNSPAWGQEEISRKAKIRVEPTYPELARHMNLGGVVRLQVTVAANGTVKNAKLIGGHPLLANAALDAIKKWRFEAGPAESSGVVQFRFDPQQ
jgi:TonB family protein